MANNYQFNLSPFAYFEPSFLKLPRLRVLIILFFASQDYLFLNAISHWFAGR